MCWKKRVAFAMSTGVQVSTSYEHCFELPRAIATTDGKPVKGTKSNTTKALESDTLMQPLPSSQHHYNLGGCQKQW